MINTVFLPLCLASMMLIVGTSLEGRSFNPILTKPKAMLIGLLAQLFLLPLLAWALIGIFQLSGGLAIGLLLVAAAPGGATSNLFSYIAKADVALSVALTAIMSLLAPLWMPWAVQIQLGWLGTNSNLQLPLLQSAMQLILVTALPLLLGMGLRRLAHSWVIAHETWLKRTASTILLLMITMLVITNWQRLAQNLNLDSAVLVVLLASLALLVGYWLARLCALDSQVARTLSFETGVQNAGVAMLIAFTQLKLPEAGLVALLYGLLMNIPTLATLWWFTRRK